MAWFGYCGSKIQNSGGHCPSLSNGEEGSKKVTQHSFYYPFLSLTVLHSWRVMKFMYTVHPKTQIPEAKKEVLFFPLNFSSLMAQTWSLRTRPKRWKTPQLWNLGPSADMFHCEASWSYSERTRFHSSLISASENWFSLQCQFGEALCIVFSSHASVSASQTRW